MTMRSLAKIAAIGLAMLVTFSSCTFEYFEDEMNYKVYVPEFKQKLVENCRVILWNTATGEKAGDIFAMSNQTEDNVLEQGIFAFRVGPGSYRACVLTDVDSVGHYGTEDLQLSSFALDRKDNSVFKAPRSMLFDYIERTLIAQGQEVCDTAKVELYPAKLTVRYRGNDVPAETCRKARMRLTNIATEQRVMLDTLTSGVRDAKTDYIFDNVEAYPLSGDGARFEVSGLLFPTVENEMLKLHIEFKDAASRVIAAYAFSLSTRDSKPLRIFHSQHVIIDIYNEGFMITIRGWDDHINAGEVEIDGGKHNKTDGIKD